MENDDRAAGERRAARPRSHLFTVRLWKEAEMLRDVFGREMTHRVENEVLGEGRIAFNEVCEYPDGTRVLSAVTLDVRDGKIVRQVNIEAWDE